MPFSPHILIKFPVILVENVRLISFPPIFIPIIVRFGRHTSRYRQFFSLAWPRFLLRFLMALEPFGSAPNFSKNALGFVRVKMMPEKCAFVARKCWISDETKNAFRIHPILRLYFGRASATAIFFSAVVVQSSSSSKLDTFGWLVHHRCKMKRERVINGGHNGGGVGLLCVVFVVRFGSLSPLSARARAFSSVLCVLFRNALIFLMRIKINMYFNQN